LFLKKTLFSKGKSYQFSARTPEERADWIGSVQQFQEQEKHFLKLSKSVVTLSKRSLKVDGNPDEIK